MTTADCNLVIIAPAIASPGFANGLGSSAGLTNLTICFVAEFNHPFEASPNFVKDHANCNFGECDTEAKCRTRHRIRRNVASLTVRVCAAQLKILLTDPVSVLVLNYQRVRPCSLNVPANAESRSHQQKTACRKHGIFQPSQSLHTQALCRHPLAAVYRFGAHVMSSS